MAKFKRGDLIVNKSQTIYQKVEGTSKDSYMFRDPLTKTSWYMPIALVDIHWHLATDEEAEIIYEEEN